MLMNFYDVWGRLIRNPFRGCDMNGDRMSKRAEVLTACHNVSEAFLNYVRDRAAHRLQYLVPCTLFGISGVQRKIQFNNIISIDKMSKGKPMIDLMQPLPTKTSKFAMNLFLSLIMSECLRHKYRPDEAVLKEWMIQQVIEGSSILFPKPFLA
jgi:hypothetical protein